MSIVIDSSTAQFVLLKRSKNSADVILYFAKMTRLTDSYLEGSSAERRVTIIRDLSFKYGRMIVDFALYGISGAVNRCSKFEKSAKTFTMSDLIGVNPHRNASANLFILTPTLFFCLLPIF